MLRRDIHQQADSPHTSCLLRVSGERPRRNAAQKSDKLPPPHSITSSAATSRLCGITALPLELYCDLGQLSTSSGSYCASQQTQLLDFRHGSKADMTR
jgi:hypothetical protein